MQYTKGRIFNDSEDSSSVSPTTVQPLVYKALISQSAPVTGQTSGSLIKGALYLITYHTGDDFSNIGGPGLGTPDGSITYFYPTDTTPAIWTNGSSADYDGSPYVVSIDSTGYFGGTLVNTIDPGLNYGYLGTGRFTVSSVGSFPQGKTFLYIKPTLANGSTNKVFAEIARDSDDGLNIFTYKIDAGSNRVAVNGFLNNAEISIEVYP